MKVEVLKMDRKLKFDMIPAGCWKNNLHVILSKKAWDFIKKDAKIRSGGNCSICGKKTKYLDAHEVWSYDIEKGIQKLDDVIAICKDCHNTIHIGRSQLVGCAEKAEDHYMKVNKCSYAEMRADLGQANQLYNERNKVDEWKTDLTWLNRFLNQNK